MLIRTRAPVRIDFAGGWTDVALFTEDSKGLVVNGAINRYAYATLAFEGETEFPESIELQRVIDKSIRIYSADFDTFVEAEDVRQLEYDGNIDLVKAAVRQMSIQFGGFDLITQSNAPPGSGLGTSAAMGVTLIGVLGALKDITYVPYQYAELASSIERHELGILGGKQDHYASAVGGISFMEFQDEEVKTSSLTLPPNIRYELEKNLVLCYTGQSRLSGNIHQNVTEAYKSKEPGVRKALNNLKEIAESTKNALMRGRLSDFGELLTENWQNQKKLHPSVTNDRIEKLFTIANENGAIGGKVCGAGGGGCLLFYCQPTREHNVRQKLEDAGTKIIDFNFDFDGLQIWRAD
ncbi:GHMP kinase [Candidatus Poribacteria bacterium]|nr:GHMP kinase [Candidatus Poribacteria bacterium]